MPDKTFNPITETYTIKHRNDKSRQFVNVFEEMANNDDNRDLVLLCGKEKLSYHSEVVAAVFPFIKKFVQNSKSCPCSVYIQNKAEIFISLDGVDPKTMKQMMACIYENKPLKFSRQTLGEVRDVFKMLGADDKLFVIEKNESRSQRPEARNGDVFRKVLGITGAFDTTGKRKVSKGDEEEPIAKKRVVDINMREDEIEPVLPKREETSEKEVKSNDAICSKEEEKSIEPSKPVEIEKPVVFIKPAETFKSVEVSKPVLEIKPVEPIKTDVVEKLSPKPEVEAKHPIPREVIPPQTPREVAALIAEPKPKDANLQMILPHLTVTTIKQEPKESMDTSNQMPVIKQEPVEYGETPPVTNPVDAEGSSVLRCPLALCSSEIMFKTRSEILLHLTQAHYTEGLLELFPFNKGQPCKICVDEKKPKVLIAQIKNRYIAHIGVNHEIVMDLLPAELKEILMVLPKRIKRMSRPETPVSRPEVDITLDEAPASTPPNPAYPSYPSNYNYNYPANPNYPPIQPQPPFDQSAYPQPAYPGYNSYPPQYPPSTPIYPSYAGYSFDAASNQAAPGPQPIKVETTAVVKEEPAVVIKQEPLEQVETVYKCTLCTARSFRERSDLLFHLSITHFSRNLNQMYPFKDNQVCPLCNQFKPKNMSSHISHVGLKHEEVIKFLPADLASTLSPSAGGDNMPIMPAEVPQVTPVLETPVAQPVQKQEPAVQPAPPVSEEEPSVQCEMCKANSKVRLFTKRSEFLKHLSLLHFGKALLQAFPFAEGRNCNLCFETSKKMYTPSKKEVHVCHVGVLHAKIFELLPKEILQQVMEMPTMKKAVPNNPESAVSAQQVRRPETLVHTMQGAPAGVSSINPHSAVAFQNPLPPPTPMPKVSSNHMTSQSTVQSFAPPPPRDAGFKLPAANPPAKDEFKLPMTKTDKPYNCRYCVSGFDVAKDLKDHLLTHKSQFSQINQTPRKMNSSLVNLRMNTPRK